VQAFVDQKPRHPPDERRPRPYARTAGHWTEIGWVPLWSVALVAMLAALTMRLYSSER
jgi:hypothetical protein